MTIHFFRQFKLGVQGILILTKIVAVFEKYEFISFVLVCPIKNEIQCN